MPTVGSTSTGYAHFIILVIIYSSSMLVTMISSNNHENNQQLPIPKEHKSQSCTPILLHCPSANLIRLSFQVFTKTSDYLLHHNIGRCKVGHRPPKILA